MFQTKRLSAFQSAGIAMRLAGIPSCGSFISYGRNLIFAAGAWLELAAWDFALPAPETPRCEVWAPAVCADSPRTSNPGINDVEKRLLVRMMVVSPYFPGTSRYSIEGSDVTPQSASRIATPNRLRKDRGRPSRCCKLVSDQGRKRLQDEECGRGAKDGARDWFWLNYNARATSGFA